MRLQIVILLLFFTPLFSMAQSSSDWQLYLNKTKLLSASTDNVENVQLSKSGQGTLKLVFVNLDTSFNRSVIIMNEQRNTLLKQEMEKSCDTIKIAIAELLSKTKGESFSIYITDIPTDPAIAATMRIAPVAIGKITWKE